MKFFIILTAVCLIAISGQTQEKRSIKAEKSVESFRPIGDMRIWAFFGNQKTFGRISSIMLKPTEINNKKALQLEQGLRIDYTQIGGEKLVEVSGKTYLSSSGSYLGNDLLLGSETEGEEFKLTRKGQELSGYYTRSGNKIDITQQLSENVFAWDPYFVDQLEIFLAMRDIQVGDSLIDSIFMPQSLVTAPVRGYVKYWMWQEIYKGSIDSVFIISLSEPQEYQLYFTADKRLVRVDMINQDIRVYQDMIRTTKPKNSVIPEIIGSDQMNPIEQMEKAKKNDQFNWKLLFFMSPHYVAFLIIAILSILLLSGWRGGWWRGSTLYLSFGGGLLLYVVVPLLQLPVQKYIVSSLIIPMVNDGGSIYTWGLLPSLISGILQTALFLIGLQLLITGIDSGRKRAVLIGAALGAGFAFAESCYVSGLGVMPLFSWPLVERIFLILFHTGAGTFIAYGLVKNRNLLPQILVTTTLVGTTLRYLPLFVQQGDFEVELLHFVLAFITLVFISVVIVLQRKDYRTV